MTNYLDLIPSAESAANTHFGTVAQEERLERKLSYKSGYQKGVKEAVKALLGLLDELRDEGDCWFDHHGGCQEHGFLHLEPGETCPHQDAKETIEGMKNA